MRSELEICASDVYAKFADETLDKAYPLELFALFASINEKVPFILFSNPEVSLTTLGYSDFFFIPSPNLFSKNSVF